MEHIVKIKEISPEPILVRKSKKFISRLPLLTRDKSGRLILLTDNLKKYVNTYKMMIFGLIFLSCSLGRGAAQEFKDMAIEGGEFAQWEKFTNAFGEPGNSTDKHDSRSGAVLKQTTPGAIVTSSGNIYNPGGINSFVLQDTVVGTLKQISLQVWEAGVPLDYGSFELIAGDVIIKGERSEGSKGENGIISLVNFDLLDKEIKDTDYEIKFKASGSHMSLVAVRLDLLEDAANNPLTFRKIIYENGEFAEWDKFTVGFGDPGNSADVDGSKESAKISQKTPGAMATGSGSIYNPGGVSKFVLTDKVEGKLKAITLQVWTKGSPANYESFQLKSGDSEVKGVRSEVATGEEGLISLIKFELGDIVLEDAAYSINFSAAAPHMSLAAVRLDLDLEPEVVFEFKDLSTLSSEYAEWDNFTVGFGDPGNEANVGGSRSGVKLTQKTQGAMATGGGSIYNPAGKSQFVVSDSVEGKLDKLTFQIWTKGSPANYGSFVLRSGETQVGGVRAEVISGDDGVISLVNFDLSEGLIQDTEYTIEFEAVGPHMSLVAARLDYETKDVVIDYESMSGPGWSHDGWINFENPVGWNEPDLEGSSEVTFEFGALLRQRTPGAIMTSAKNIYNPGGVSVFEIVDTISGGIVNLVLQVRTSGTPINPGSVILKVGEQDLRGVYSEVARKKTNYGYEIITKYDFNLSKIRPNEYSIEFAAAGPHMSLISARVDKQITANFDLSTKYEAKFNEVSDDRWTYPRNSTPGTRNLAPVFGYVSGDGDSRVAQRYGQMIVGFDTMAKVPSGLHHSQYRISSAKVETTVALDSQFYYDGTSDDYSKYDGETDSDSPVELFGTGFRNGYNGLTWDEESPLKSEGFDYNNVYSLGYENGMAIDVDQFVFSEPFKAIPFAIGQIDGLEQGDLVPEDSVFQFEINVSDGDVQRYIAKSLASGKLFFTLSQILYAKTEDGGKGYPDFYTRDHILGESPTLKIEFEIVPAKLEPPTLSIKRNNKGGLIIEWSGKSELQSAATLGRSAIWTTVQTIENKHEIFAEGLHRFYRVKGQ